MDLNEGYFIITFRTGFRCKFFPNTVQNSCQTPVQILDKSRDFFGGVCPKNNEVLHIKDVRNLSKLELFSALGTSAFN